MESEDELPSLSSTSRALRALTIIVISILTIAVAGLGYLHPGLGFGSNSDAALAPASKLRAAYQLAAVDFVTPTVGWVVVELRPQTFAVLHTSDSGKSWTRQLAGPAGIIGEYARFFDPMHGVVALLGPQGMLYQTADGGKTWNWHMLAQYGGYIWSADFIDANHGWLLAQDPTEGESLLRTEDGGKSWTALGNPVQYSDWAYRVQFASAQDGWLYSQSAEPYAYRTKDGGSTWSRVGLPEPLGGWPAVQGGAVSTGEFFVAVHPTAGAGLIATVVAIAPPNGRSPAGGVVVGYPPLRVGTWDGGRPVTYVYADVGPYRYSSFEHLNPDPYLDDQPVTQYQLSSVDGGLSWDAISPPSTGAVGYIDAANWWWIGSGRWSTSSDAGRSWTQKSGIGVVEPMPGSLQFIDATHAWFGAMAGAQPLVESTDDGGVSWRMIVMPAIVIP